MRANDFLLESTLSAKTIANKIKKDCASFLQQIVHPDDYRLYRGVSNGTKVFAKGNNPIDRQPRDTEFVIHDVADQWFAKEFNIKYRSNAVFCTGSYSDAENYGKLYLTFPIGEFRFCWSPKVGDMTYLFEGAIEPSEYYEKTPDHKLNAERYHNVVNDIKFRHDIFTTLDKCEYTEDNLPRAISNGNEIMVHCPAGYYMLRVSDDGFGIEQEVLTLLEGKDPNAKKEMSPEEKEKQINNSKSDIVWALTILKDTPYDSVAKGVYDNAVNQLKALGVEV